MGLLPWTIGFLLCLASICMFQYRAASDSHLLHTIILSSISTHAKKATKNVSIKARSIHARYNPKISPPPISDDSLTHHAPQASSHVLHIAALLSAHDSEFKKATTYLFHSLLKVLYGDYQLFEHNSQEEVERLFSLVFTQALTRAHMQPISQSCDLANIPIPNDETGQYRHVLLHILRGGDGECVAGHPCRLLSLPYFISFIPRPHLLRLFSAKPHVLMALFQREEIVQKIIFTRIEMREKLAQNPLSQSILEQEFKTQFTPYLPQEVPEQYIDFRIDT